jgi:hypothetical protein
VWGPLVRWRARAVACLVLHSRDEPFELRLQPIDPMLLRHQCIVQLPNRVALERHVGFQGVDPIAFGTQVVLR